MENFETSPKSDYQQRLDHFGVTTEIPANCPRVRIRCTLFLPAFDWCNERFDNRWIWFTDKADADTGTVVMYFLNPEDATLFALSFPPVQHHADTS